MKFLVFLMNLLFWVLGLLLIGLAVWMLTDPIFNVGMTQDSSDYYTGISLLLVVGTLLFLTGFLGCCGAHKENQCMLVMFVCLLIVIVVAQISAGWWAYCNSEQLEKLVRKSIESTVQNEYGLNPRHTKTFDIIQRDLRCCGANGPTDWANSKYRHSNGTEGINLEIGSKDVLFSIPASCCSPELSVEMCEAARNSVVVSGYAPSIFKEGCMDKMLSVARQHMFIIIGIILGVGIVEFVGIIFSLILCCAIRAVNRYKN